MPEVSIPFAEDCHILAPGDGLNLVALSVT